jgi:hypothetical protein
VVNLKAVSKSDCQRAAGGKGNAPASLELAIHKF